MTRSGGAGAVRSEPPKSRHMRRVPAPALVAVLALVLWAGLPAPVHASSDPGYDRQWALTQIHAPEAWTRATGAGVRIGIVDTGVDLAHEDLGGRVVAHTSCVGSGGDPACGRGPGQDDNGHGTFVAGVAAASTGNGVGIAGVAPAAELVVAKVLDASNTGTVPDIVAGIRWVVDHGAQVVNISISDGPGATTDAAASLHQALEYAWQRGAIPVVAAGHSDYGPTNALIVTSTTSDGDPAGDSGGLGSAKWGLAAPGGDPGACSRWRVARNCILSTSWAPGEHDEYRYAAGSSAAAPHVSGVAAQLLSVGYDPAGAVRRLLETADISRPCGPACHGVLNAAGALAVEVVPAAPSAARAPEAVPAPAPAAAPAPPSAPAASFTPASGPVRVVTDAGPVTPAAGWAPSSAPSAPAAMVSRPRAVLELAEQFEGVTRRSQELQATLARAVRPGSQLPLLVAGLSVLFLLVTTAVRSVSRK